MNDQPEEKTESSTYKNRNRHRRKLYMRQYMRVKRAQQAMKRKKTKEQETDGEEGDVT